jgi:O-antigen ligase
MPRAAALTPATDSFRVGLAALTIMTMSRAHQHFGVLSSLRPALLVTVFLTVYVFLQWREFGDMAVFRRWPPKIMAALGVWACLSALFGVSLGHSASFILDSYWKVLYGAALVLLAIRTTRDIYTIVWALVLSGGALAYLSLFVFQMETVNGATRLAEGYSYDANDIGCVALPLMALSLLVLHVSKPIGKLVAGGIFIALTMTLAKTGSRGALVGFAVMCVAIFFLSSYASILKRSLIVLISISCLALAAPQGYWQQMNTILDPKEDYNWTSPTGRRAVFLRGVGYMAEHPIFGLGIGNFDMAEGMLSDRARELSQEGEGVKWSAAHNSFLQAGAELGVPGAILFFVLVIGTILDPILLRRKLLRYNSVADPEGRFLFLACIYLPAATVGFAGAAVFVSFAWLDAIYYLAALVAGVRAVAEVRLRRMHSRRLTVGDARFQRYGGVPRSSLIQEH